MLTQTRTEHPKCSIGCDWGSKFDGYSIVTGKENSLSVKLDLPKKQNAVVKMTERRQARRSRRQRLRQRPVRFDNRSRKDWLAPSQTVIVSSRLKVMDALHHMFPIDLAGIEDVCFNHAKYRWGRHFSTIEIGKTRLRKWFDDRGIERHEFKGYQTAEFRKDFGYKKTSSKTADKFSSHCCDSLTLALKINGDERIAEGRFIVCDDTYRSVRRKLHDSNLKVGGLREKYSHGTVQGIQKGKMIGTKKGKGQLCGEDRGSFRYYDLAGKRKTAKAIAWVKNQFKGKLAA
jgi:hypothetical protein